MKYIYSKALSLGLISVLAACQAPGLSFEPVNKTIQTQLPATHEKPTQQLFSFRLIAPPEHVSLFSVLQAFQNDPGVVALRQKTLPVEQLEEVQVAKEKIQNAEYLNPDNATILAFETARIYSWDTEIARQIINEIIETYAERRNEEQIQRRALAEERALYFQNKAAVAVRERQAQSDAVREAFFGNIPNPRALTIEEQNDNRKRYFQYIQDKLIKSQRAQAEYNKQAQATLARQLAERDEQTLRAREKEEEAQRLREAAFKQILQDQGIDTIEPQNPPQQPQTFTTQAASEAKAYQLTALANGDFLLDAHDVLPATLSLKVKDFDLPIIVPVLPQTHNGRLLLSIEKDPQGRPVVKGGLDAISGFQFDMGAPIFTLRYLDDQQQELTFVYPDGTRETIDINKLKQMTYAQAQVFLTQNHKPSQRETVDTTDLQSLRQRFSSISYDLTPELDYLPPEQAVDIIKGLNL